MTSVFLVERCQHARRREGQWIGDEGRLREEKSELRGLCPLPHVFLHFLYGAVIAFNSASVNNTQDTFRIFENGPQRLTEDLEMWTREILLSESDYYHVRLETEMI